MGLLSVHNHVSQYLRINLSMYVYIRERNGGSSPVCGCDLPFHSLNHDYYCDEQKFFILTQFNWPDISFTVLGLCAALAVLGVFPCIENAVQVWTASTQDSPLRPSTHGFYWELGERHFLVKLCHFLA